MKKKKPEILFGIFSFQFQAAAHTAYTCPTDLKSCLLETLVSGADCRDTHYMYFLPATSTSGH